MPIVNDLANQLAHASKSEFPENLCAAVNRRTIGMDDPSIATELENDSAISFLPTAMASRTQHHAENQPTNAWHRTMEEVSVAPQYKFTTFGLPPPQASAADIPSPAAVTQPSTSNTASLQATVAQLKEDNTKAETNQEELQN